MLDWRDSVDVFEREFEDKKAQQVITKLVWRIKQGRQQHFHEFLKEFDENLALSGGDGIFT